MRLGLAAVIAGVVLLGACSQAAAPSDSASPSATALARSPQPTPAATPTASATVSPSSSARSIPLATWSQAASQAGSAVVTDVTHGDAGFVAVGYDRDEGRSSNPLFGRTWVSSEGTTWELVPPDGTFDRAYLSDVVSTPDGSYLAFGRIETEGFQNQVPFAMWESRDGRAWRRTESGLPGDSSVQVAAGAKGYLVSAMSAEAVHQLWHSVDARSWQLVREQYEDIQRIAAGDDGFVAVGVREAALYVMASADAREWFEGQSNLDLALHFAAVGGDWVMAGYPTEPGVLPVLFSTNGLDWERTAGVEIPSSEVFPEAMLIASTGPTVFLSLGVPGAHPAMVPAGIWSSDDGRSWPTVDLASDVFLAAAATSGQVEVLAANFSGAGDSVVGAVFYVRTSGE